MTNNTKLNQLIQRMEPFWNEHSQPLFVCVTALERGNLQFFLNSKAPPPKINLGFVFSNTLARV
jgi:hypothetical protein